jgi:two-component system sensor histidine kinase YesM
MGRVGLRTKLVISFIVLSVLPVLLLLFTVFRQYVQDVERTVNQYTSEVVGQVHRGLSTYLNDIDRILSLRDSYYVSQYAALYDTGQQEESFRFGYRIWEDFNFI